MAGKFRISGGAQWKMRLQKLVVKAQVRAGILEGATNSEGESVAAYAAMNEYGTPDIPSRPFMRTTLNQNGAKWCEGVKNAINGGMAPENALALMGRRMADDIQATIKSNMPPPNSKAWAEYKNRDEIERSGVTRAGTLINTGAMINSVNWEFGDDESA